MTERESENDRKEIDGGGAMVVRPRLMSARGNH